MECSLVEWGSTIYPNPPVVKFDKATGCIDIRSSDYSLDGLLLNLKLTCSSPYSQQPTQETSDVDFVEIEFQSECRGSVLTSPTP